MLDGMKRRVAATALGSLLRSLATSNDTKTTIVGAIAGAMLAIPGLDLQKVIAGDTASIARVVAGLLVALIGYLATKQGQDGNTTVLGAIAAALQIQAGSVQSVVSAVVIAAMGYFTNKPAGGK
jgi:hypothetical protein